MKRLGQVPKEGTPHGHVKERKEMRSGRAMGASNHGTDAWIPHVLKAAEVLRVGSTAWCPACVVILAALGVGCSQGRAGDPLGSPVVLVAILGQ